MPSPTFIDCVGPCRSQAFSEYPRHAPDVGLVDHQVFQVLSRRLYASAWNNGGAANCSTAALPCLASQSHRWLFGQGSPPWANIGGLPRDSQKNDAKHRFKHPIKQRNGCSCQVMSARPSLRFQSLANLLSRHFAQGSSMRKDPPCRAASKLQAKAASNVYRMIHISCRHLRTHTRVELILDYFGLLWCSMVFRGFPLESEIMSHQLSACGKPF